MNFIASIKKTAAWQIILLMNSVRRIMNFRLYVFRDVQLCCQRVPRVLILLCGFCSSQIIFAVEFSNDITLDTGLISDPYAVARGDFNADGRLDIAVTDEAAGKVSVYLNLGDGNFSGEVEYSTGEDPRAITVGDFDNINGLDLAVANFEPDTVSILLNNGDGSFAAKVDYPAGRDPTSITSADFDGDNDIDLAVANFNASTVSILVNLGGVFPETRVEPEVGEDVADDDIYPTGIQPRGITNGDFNGDNAIDLAVANLGSNSVSVLFNNGDGSYADKIDYDVGANPFSLVADDFDREDGLDLAVVNVSSGDVSVLLNIGDGSFGTLSSYTAGANPFFIISSNLDGLNGPDLAVVNVSSDTVSIFFNEGDGTYSPKDDYSTGASPRSIASGDFDGIKGDDLAIANAESNNVQIFLNSGGGTFADKVDYVFEAGAQTSSVSSADFDGINGPDLAVANSGLDTVSVLLNMGDGSYADKIDYVTGVGSQPLALLSADVAGDSATDLVVANSIDNELLILINNGDGSYSAGATRPGTGADPGAVVSGDFDGNNGLDLAVANSNAESVSVFLRNSDGSFADKVDYSTGSGSQPVSITSGDFDGIDGLDLAVADINGNRILVLLNNGAGGYTVQVDPPLTGSGPASIASGDFDGLNGPDLVVANSNDDTVSVFLGAGDGTFAAKVDYETGQMPQSVAIGDFDVGKGLDLAVANFDDDTVSILLNNGDGSFTENVDYITGEGPYSVVSGDLDGVNGSDLAVANRDAGTVSVLLNSTDRIPIAFSFIDRTNVALDTTIVSNTVTLAGLDGGSPVTVSDGEYNINGGVFTSSAGTVLNGDRVSVRQTSSTESGTTTDAILTVGGVSDTFSATTVSDTTPDPFSFESQTDVPVSVQVFSNTVTITGLGDLAVIAVNSGEYSVNSSPFTSASSFIANNSTVTLRQLSSANTLTTTTALLIIGGVSATFDVTTSSINTSGNGNGGISSGNSGGGAIGIWIAALLLLVWKRQEPNV